MGLGANRRCLYVGGLTRQVTEQVLHAAFVPFGPIKEIQIPSDTDVGKSSLTVASNGNSQLLYAA